MVHTKVTEVSVKMADETKRNIPLLPLRGLLVYPTMVLHLDVGREKSVQALEQAMMNDHMIFLATQKDISIDEPDEDEIFTFGTYTKSSRCSSCRTERSAFGGGAAARPHS